MPNENNPQRQKIDSNNTPAEWLEREYKEKYSFRVLVQLYLQALHSGNDSKIAGALLSIKSFSGHKFNRALAKVNCNPMGPIDANEINPEKVDMDVYYYYLDKLQGLFDSIYRKLFETKENRSPTVEEMDDIVIPFALIHSHLRGEIVKLTEVHKNSPGKIMEANLAKPPPRVAKRLDDDEV